MPPMIRLGLIATLTESPTEVSWSPKFVVILFGLALPCTSVVYWLWFSVLETLPLNRANAYSFLVPIFALSMGIAFYGEVFTVSVAVGASLTFLGIVLVNRADNTEPTVIEHTAEQPALGTTAS